MLNLNWLKMMLHRIVNFFIICLLSIINVMSILLLRIANYTARQKVNEFVNSPLDITEVINNRELEYELSVKLSEDLLYFIESWMGYPIAEAASAGLCLDSLNMLAIKLNTQYVYSIYLANQDKTLADHVQNWEQIMDEENNRVKHIVAEKLYEFNKEYGNETF